jgi:hypothetical protein
MVTKSANQTLLKRSKSKASHFGGTIASNFGGIIGSHLPNLPRELTCRRPGNKKCV